VCEVKPAERKRVYVKEGKNYRKQVYTLGVGTS